MAHKNKNNTFAFIVHPRNEYDIYKKLPLLRFLPKNIMRLFQLHFPPIIVSNFKGINGFVVSIPTSAKLMLENRAVAARNVRRAVLLARARGATVVSLGALTSPITRGGLDLADIKNIKITNGRTYTAHIVAQNTLNIIKDIGVNVSESKVAIIGSTMTVGKLVKKLLTRAGINNFILLDRKATPDLSLVKQAQFIITLTAHPDMKLNKKHVAKGSVIINDAQPRGYAKDLLDNKDLLVIEGGIAHTPNIRTLRYTGVHGENNNYSCIAEGLILTIHPNSPTPALGCEPSLEVVDKLAQLGKDINFGPSQYQNPNGKIDSEHVHSFRYN